MAKKRTMHTTSDQQIAALMQLGLEASQAGQRARARRYFAAVLEIDPAQVGAWLERAAIVDNPHEAMAHLARVLELDPGNQRARQMLKDMRRKVGNMSAYRAPTVPPASSSGTPVPRPLVPLPGPRQPMSSVWLTLGVLGFALVLALFLWSDAPRTVVAALLPTDTPTPTRRRRPHRLLPRPRPSRPRPLLPPHRRPPSHLPRPGCHPSKARRRNGSRLTFRANASTLT